MLSITFFGLQLSLRNKIKVICLSENLTDDVEEYGKKDIKVKSRGRKIGGFYLFCDKYV